MGSLDRSTAITASSGIVAGVASPDTSMRIGAFAGTAAVAIPGSGVACAVALVSALTSDLSTIACSARSGIGAADKDGVKAGPRITVCSIDVCFRGALTNVLAGSRAATRAGTNTTCRSGASIRRSRQGKPKPGSPSPWPSKVKLNSSA